MITNIAFAQNDTLILKDLELPTSPGFILLDQAPTSIERPNTTRAFTLSVLNSFAQSNGFPKNYAVELTPYWFLRFKNMNALSYVGFKDEKARPFSCLKMISLSVAYINSNDSLTNKPINNVAFGARTTILKVYPKGYKNKLLSAISNTEYDLEKLKKDLIKAGATDSLRLVNKKLYEEIKAPLLKTYSEKTLNALGDTLKIKPLFSIDGAIAYNTFFINNDFSTNQFGRFGAWTTLNLAINLNKDNTNYFNLYTVGRYLSDGTSKSSSGEYQVENFIDFGGKLEFEFDKFSLGYEYIYRTNDKNNTNRSTGLLKYKLAENMFLTGAFGKNFGDSNNLVSLLGINWGLSTGNEKAKVK